MNYVYIESEHGPDFNLYTVGFYKPDGTWNPESDHSEREKAADRVAYLNGSGTRKNRRVLMQEVLMSEKEQKLLDGITEHNESI